MFCILSILSPIQIALESSLLLGIYNLFPPHPPCTFHSWPTPQPTCSLLKCKADYVTALISSTPHFISSHINSPCSFQKSKTKTKKQCLIVSVTLRTLFNISFILTLFTPSQHAGTSFPWPLQHQLPLTGTFTCVTAKHPKKCVFCSCSRKAPLILLALIWEKVSTVLPKLPSTLLLLLRGGGVYFLAFFIHWTVSLLKAL